MSALALVVNFGSSRAGLTTVGYLVRNAAGDVVRARSTQGVQDLGGGVYQGSWQPPAGGGVFVVLWDTGGATPLFAAESIDVYGTELPAPDSEPTVRPIHPAGAIPAVRALSSVPVNALVQRVRDELGPFKLPELTDQRIVEYLDGGQSRMQPGVLRPVYTTLQWADGASGVQLPADWVRTERVQPLADGVVPARVESDGAAWIFDDPAHVEAAGCVLHYRASWPALTLAGACILPAGGADALVSYATARGLQRVLAQRGEYTKYAVTSSANGVDPEDIEHLAERHLKDYESAVQQLARDDLAAAERRWSGSVDLAPASARAGDQVAMIAAVRAELGELDSTAFTERRIADYLNEGQDRMVPTVLLPSVCAVAWADGADGVDLPADHVRTTALRPGDGTRLPELEEYAGRLRFARPATVRGGTAELRYGARFPRITEADECRVPAPGPEACVAWALHRLYGRLAGDHTLAQRITRQTGGENSSEAMALGPADYQRLADGARQRYDDIVETLGVQTVSVEF